MDNIPEHPLKENTGIKLTLYWEISGTQIRNADFPDVLCDLTDLIWRKGTPFETMAVRTAPSPGDLLAVVFRGFPQLYGKCQEICAQLPELFSYHT